MLGNGQSDAETVAAALHEIGASQIEITPAGEVDFKLSHMGAWAYHLTADGYRLSFILAVDPPEAVLDRWIDAHADLSLGFVRVVESDGSSNLLYTVDLDHDSTLALVAETALDLRADWEGPGEHGITDTLAGAGLLRPPLGSFAPSDIRTYGPWWWGTRPFDAFTLYMFEVDAVVAALIERGPFFAMSHAGHGMNSYGLNVVTAGGPFAALFQHGFGGVYTSPLRARLAINQAYSYLHVLMEAEEIADVTNPRWLLVFSEFRGSCGIINLEAVRTGTSASDAFTAIEGFEQLLGAAAALVPNDEFGAEGVAIEWPPTDLG